MFPGQSMARKHGDDMKNILFAVFAWLSLLPACCYSTDILRGSFEAGGAPPATEVTRTGDVLNIGSNTDSGSQSITAPSDAEFMVVFVGGFPGDGGATGCRVPQGSLTYNSAALTMSYVTPDGEECSPGRQSVTVFTLLSPSTGANTLAWDWNGTGNTPEGVNINILFYKNVANSSPVKATGGHASTETATDITTGAMTTSADADRIVCAVDTYSGGDTDTVSGGVSSLANGAYNSNDYRIFDGQASSTSATIVYNQSDQYSAMACVVIAN